MKRISGIIVLCTHFVCCSSTLSHQAGPLQFYFPDHPCILIASETRKTGEKEKQNVADKMKVQPFRTHSTSHGLQEKLQKLLQCTIWSTQHQGKKVSKSVPSRQTYILPQTVTCSLKSRSSVLSTELSSFVTPKFIFHSRLCITVTCWAINLIWLTHCPMENATQSLRSDVPCSV